MSRLLVAVALALVVVPSALAAAPPPAPRYDEQGRLVKTPFAPAAPKPNLTEDQSILALESVPKVKHWLARYPKSSLVKQGTYDSTYHDWNVGIWSGKAGEIASGRVDDFNGIATESWTGPQVAWKMARGGSGGAFGGKKINSWPVWLGFCAVFLLGLADLRRPVSLRNLDLVALLSFTVSLWYFNHGHIFASASLVYPGFAYLLARMLWIGIRNRPPPTSRPLWPVWILAAATVFVGGFKVGLNIRDSNVIDVGFAGPIGAERIVHGQSPYGNFPVEENLQPCGPADRDGEIRDRVQTNGRCESANPNGDTYGPVSYLAYLPGFAFFGWSGKWDSLPAAHFTSIAFDLLCLIGLGLVGRRFGGNRLGVTLAFAWAAYPFTQYVSNSNTNDAIMPAFLIWGFWLVTSHRARGFFAGLAGWTKFAALVVAPMWATYPEFRWDAGRRRMLWYLVGFAAGDDRRLLGAAPRAEPAPRCARLLGPDDPDPDRPRLAVLDLGLAPVPRLGHPRARLHPEGARGPAPRRRARARVRPRQKSPLQLAALTGALLIGFELVLTHWFYLYLPWFFAFAAYAVLAGEPRAAEAPVTSPDERPARELVAAG